MQKAASARAGVQPTADISRRVREHVERCGSVAEAARALDLSRSTIVTIVAGAPVRRGTLVMTLAALDRFAAVASSTSPSIEVAKAAGAR